MDEQKEPLFKVNSNINADEIVDEVTSKNKRKVAEEEVAKKKFLDINLSWGMLVVVALLTIGIGYANQMSLSTLSMNKFLYTFLFVVLSFLSGLLAYNFGKILFGFFAGYKIGNIDILGFKLIFGNKDLNKKFKCIYNVKTTLEIHMNMVPARDSAKPKTMLLGGLISSIFFASIFLTIGFTLTGNAKNTLIFGTCMALIILFYEMCPVKLDCPNDMYYLINIKDQEGIDAYNTYLKNYYLSLVLEKEAETKYEKYDSRIKPLTLLGLLHSQVLEHDFASALTTIELINSNKIYLQDAPLCEAMAENLFIFILQGRSSEADKLVVKYTHTLKNSSNYSKSLGTLRADIAISGLIDNSKEETKHCVEVFVKRIKVEPNYKDLEVVKKNIALANEAIMKINKVHPEWKISSLNSESL